MKLCLLAREAVAAQSPPSRGAWIEIWWFRKWRRPHWSSPPSRGAWIEIPAAFTMALPVSVAPLAGGVD